MINKSKKLAGPFLIDLKNKFREIAGEDQLIDRQEFQNGLDLSNNQISNRLFDIFDYLLGFVYLKYLVAQ